jgi:hypothetical protein
MDAATALQRVESENAAGNRKPDAFDRLSIQENKPRRPAPQEKESSV